MRILLLEDDVNLNETVEEFLEENGMEVVSVFDGESAEEKLFEERFDLLLLDVNVPEPNGFTLLKAAREQGITSPAIYITSLNALEDVEEGFESGADDYIRKPFALKELLLRIESIARRNYFHNPDERMKIDDNIEYDIQSGELFIGGERIALHDKESKLLKLFLQRRGEVIAHEVINEHLWSFDETPSDTALRTYIKNLRKHLGKDRIVSFKRTGYQLR